MIFVIPYCKNFCVVFFTTSVCFNTPRDAYGDKSYQATTRINLNKTGTSQVGAISKAQKAQNIFFGKKLEIFEKKNFFGKCRTVPKNVKGGPFLIYKHAFCSKITKNSKGGPFGDIKKISKKSRTVPKKIERGDPLVPSGLVGNV